MPRDLNGAKEAQVNPANFVNTYMSNLVILATIVIFDGVILPLQGLIYDLGILLQLALTAISDTS